MDDVVGLDTGEEGETLGNTLARDEGEGGETNNNGMTW